MARSRSEFEPIKIGWLGACLDGQGGGMTRSTAWPSSAKNAIDGYRWLVEQSCIAVAGAYSSDNAIVVAPYVRA